MINLPKYIENIQDLLNTKQICYLLVVILIIFGLGLLFMLTSKPKSLQESFSTNIKSQCPNILIQKGKHIYLRDSHQPEVPGVNPIKFNNLEDYVEYYKWQRSQGINCPVLFLHHSYDIQGNSVYKNRPSPLELEGGLPPFSGFNLDGSNRSQLLDAGDDNLPYNKNLYPSFDPDNQYIGLYTPLDKIYHLNPTGKSPSAIDPNWGGPKYTQKLIDKGVYKEENVKIYIPD